MSLPDEQALIEQAKQDSQAFGELYDHYVDTGDVKTFFSIVSVIFD